MKDFYQIYPISKGLKSDNLISLYKLFFEFEFGRRLDQTKLRTLIIQKDGLIDKSKEIHNVVVVIF